MTAQAPVGALARAADPPSRILVRAPSWVGDAVMATPALRALRAAHPRAEIVVEGRPALAELLAGLPSFDAFLPEVRGVPARTRGLRAREFDWAVLLPDSPRAALAPWLARIPLRAGYARDPLRAVLLTHRVPLAAGPATGGAGPFRRGRIPVPMVERYLRITRRLACPDRGTQLELRVDPLAAERVAARLAGHGVGPGERLLAVAPGARFGASKCWPPGHFAAACDGIARRAGLLPVLVPAPGEAGLARDVAARTRCALVLDDPALSLAELTALVARCALLLSNDTGPRQIAVALGRPVVAVLGPTDPRHTAHALERQRVLREAVACSPCHRPACPIDHRCMTRLAPERAVRAAVELLAEAG